MQRRAGSLLLELTITAARQQSSRTAGRDEPPACSSTGMQVRHASAGSRLRASAQRTQQLMAQQRLAREQQQQQQQEGRVQEQPPEEAGAVAGPAADPGVAQTTLQPIETTASEQQIAAVVDRPSLVVTRQIEWGTVIFGFEQANRYQVLDQDGNTVALLFEEGGGLGTEVGRQVLRTRRSFKATVTSPEGQVIFRVRRPFYLINSHMFIEDGAGNPIGEVHSQWHLWRRRLALYINRKQYAAVDSGLLAWEFLLRDDEGGVLALIDRNFSGFGREIFTDAGKYVIHFGDRPAEAVEQSVRTIQAAHPDKPAPSVTAVAQYRNPDMPLIATSTGSQLEVQRPLELDERMVALAAAINLDFIYFSRHSQGGGLLGGPMFFPGPIIPYPVPSGGGGEGGAAEAGAPENGSEAAGAGDAGAAGGQGASPGSTSRGEELEGDGPGPDTSQGAQDTLPDGDGGSWWDNDDDSGGGGDEGGGGGLFGSLSDFFPGDD